LYETPSSIRYIVCAGAQFLADTAVHVSQCRLGTDKQHGVRVVVVLVAMCSRILGQMHSRVLVAMCSSR
jgi:hypothetical protein